MFQIDFALFLWLFGGAVDSIISVFTQLHRSDFNFEFKTLFESISHMDADLQQRKGKISGSFKNSTSAALQQCQVFKKAFGIVFKFSLHFL